MNISENKIQDTEFFADLVVNYGLAMALIDGPAAKTSLIFEKSEYPIVLIDLGIYRDNENLSKTVQAILARFQDLGMIKVKDEELKLEAVNSPHPLSGLKEISEGIALYAERVTNTSEFSTDLAAAFLSEGFDKKNLPSTRFNIRIKSALNFSELEESLPFQAAPCTHSAFSLSLEVAKEHYYDKTGQSIKFPEIDP